MNEQRTSGIATVMFTDVEASTDITTRLGDDAAASLFAAHDRIVREEVAAFGGRDVRSTGDGFLVVFDSARAAVSCALSIQRELAAREEAIRVRIGLNAGEMLEGGGELFGAAVNLAARVMDRADGGEVLMTDTVRQLVGTMTGASFRDRGRVALKGFPERQRLYEVRTAEGQPQRPAPPREPSRRSWRTRALVGGVVLAACVSVVVALLHRSGSAEAVTVSPNSVAVIDPRNGRVVKAIGVDENPGPIAAGPGVVSVLNLNSETISRIDVRTRQLLGTKGVAAANNLATSPEEVWVAESACSNGGDPGTLAHFYRDGGVEISGGDDVSLATALPTSSSTVSPTAAPGCGLAARGTSAWVATNVPPGVARVDYSPVAGRSHLVRARSLPHAPNAIAVDRGSVWMVDSSQEVIRRIDANMAGTIKELRAGANPVAIAVDAEAVWVANAGDDSVSRIDPRTNGVRRAISVGEGPSAIAVGDGAVWVATGGDGSVSRIDPRTNRATATIRIGHRPQGIAIAGGLVWVTVRA
jgi:YVTN family beta-propeller protein